MALDENGHLWRPSLSGALGGRPTSPYPNAATVCMYVI